MLLGSNRSSAPRSEALSAVWARSSRSRRSRAKSMRCYQSTAIVAPGDAMLMSLSTLAYSLVAGSLADATRVTALATCAHARTPRCFPDWAETHPQAEGCRVLAHRLS